MIALNRGPTPYYHQIEAILRDKISGGELRVGDRLPSEERLCGMFEVSRATVRQAVQKLEHDGLVVREQGKGTFVSDAGGRVADLKMTCLLEDLIALGIPARTTVAEAGVVQSGAAVAEALGLRPGEPVFSFLRIVAVDDQPFSAAKVFFPAWIGDRLSADDLAGEHLLRTLSAKCGVEVTEADQVIEAVMADAYQANLLDVAAGTAVLSVTRTSFARSRVPVEYGATLYRSDRTRFLISQRPRKRGSGDWVLASRGARSSAVDAGPGQGRRTGRGKDAG